MKQERKSVELWDENNKGGGFMKVTGGEDKGANCILQGDLFKKEKKYCSICKKETEFQENLLWNNAHPQFVCLTCNIILTEVYEECVCGIYAPHYHYDSGGIHIKFCPIRMESRTIELPSGVQCSCGLHKGK